MSEKVINIQDAFLNYMRKNKVPVSIFLLNGVKITGIVSCFDKSTVVIKRDGYTQLLYKHAISTFSPHGAINVFDLNRIQQTKPTISYNTPEIDSETIEYFEEEEN